jgi:hypothetical protein
MHEATSNGRPAVAAALGRHLAAREGAIRPRDLVRLHRENERLRLALAGVVGRLAAMCDERVAFGAEIAAARELAAAALWARSIEPDEAEDREEA